MEINKQDNKIEERVARAILGQRNPKYALKIVRFLFYVYWICALGVLIALLRGHWFSLLVFFFIGILSVVLHVVIQRRHAHLLFLSCFSNIDSVESIIILKSKLIEIIINLIRDNSNNEVFIKKATGWSINDVDDHLKPVMQAIRDQISHLKQELHDEKK